MSLPEFGVKRPVVANLLMLALLLGGLIFGARIRREFFPQIDPTTVLISAPYPGAAPDEVERALASKIEDALRDLQEIKEINSTVSESVALIQVEFEPSKDIDAAVAEVKREVDALQDLPDAAERIIVQTVQINLPAIILSGFFYPVSSMPVAFQWLTIVNPVRHFLEIVRGVFLKDAGFNALWPQFVALSALALATLSYAIIRFPKTLGR